MRLLKKLTIVTATTLTLISPNFISESRASPVSHSIAFAEDEGEKQTISNSMSGLTKISTGQSLNSDEKKALQEVVKDPNKYVTTERSAEYMTALESVMKNKPNELAKEIDVDATSAFTGLQSQLASWKNNSSSSNAQGNGTALSGAEIGYKNTDDLKKNESYSTLYSSIVYSLSKGESADSTSISLAQMMRYPVVSKDDAKIEGSQYGSLASPAFAAEPQEEGKKLATYIKTLHEYNYLVTKDKTGFSGFWNWLTGGTTSFVRGFLLNVAWVGAALYDFAMWGINFFVDSFTKFNLIEITGLGAAIRGTDSFLNTMLKGMFGAMGITGSLVRTIQYLFYAIIVGSFIIALISQLRKAKAKKAVSTLQKNMLKIFTIIMTIPLTAMMYSTTAAVFDAVKLEASDAQQITSNYVINVTEWAGTMNLSLSPISTKSINATGEVDEAFKPTTANIAKINTAINALKSTSGQSNDEKAPAGKSARDQVEALISDKEATVQDYFNFIASRKTSGSGLAAEYLPKVSSTSQSASTRTYLLVSRDKKQDVKDIVKKLLGIGDDQNSSGAKASDSVQPSYTYKVANKKDVTVGLESKYDLTPVVWNNPTSYLYGAIPPGNLTTSTLNHANYHLSGYTDMLNDPSTGETAKDDDLSKALAENAINLALINKFAGVSQSGQMKTLSSQSVAFLLQSKLSNDTLVYKGYNTAANESGAAKNTGAYGITYVENVVPSTGMTDYMSKLAGLNSIWLSAGITAMAVFLALLKAPVLGSVMQHLKGFASALFTGNVISLIESMLYYLALASSFLFGYIATLVGLYLVSSLLTSTFLSYLTFLPIVGPIILSILICLLMSWPIVKLRLGVSNKTRRVGLAALLVSVPYILVEACDEYLDKFNSRLYGRSKGQSFVSKMGRQAEVLNQGQQVKNAVKRGVNAAVGGARTLAGDPTGALQVAGALKGGDPNDPNDPNGLNGTNGKKGNLLGTIATTAATGALGKEAGKIAGKLTGTDLELNKDSKIKAELEDGDKTRDPKLDGGQNAALRSTDNDHEKDRSLNTENVNNVNNVNNEQDALKFNTNRDDAAKLDEIADNTGRMINNEQEVKITDVEPSINPLNTEVVDSKKLDTSMDKVKTHVDIDDVKDGIKEQFDNLKSGGKVVANAVTNPADVARSLGESLKSKAEIVTDSKFGRNVADAIESSLTGKPIEQVKLEKNSERIERDVRKEVVRENRDARVNANYKANMQNFGNEQISRGLAQVQTAVQDLGRNKAVNTTVKIAQQAAKPFTMTADNILFDGEKVLGNAVKGIKTTDIDQLNKGRRQTVDSFATRVDQDEMIERATKNNERQIDAIEELTREVRRLRDKE